MTEQIWWHLARASGLVAWLMLTASVLWGIVLATDLFPAWRRPAWILAMHRWLAGLALFFLAGHLGSLLLDTSVRFGALDLLLPFHSSWRPTAVAAGVGALWTLIAVQTTALALRRLSSRRWRDIHLVGYWAFWGATIHAALAGTDTSRPLYIITSLAALAAIVFAVSYRILTHHLPKRRPRAAPGRRPLREGAAPRPR